MTAGLDLMITPIWVDSSSALLYNLPNGKFVTLKGWRQEIRGGALLFIGSHGEEYTSLQYVYEALQF